MTRIALVSDQHIDRSSRWEEGLRILAWIRDDIARRGVDLIALGGDLFEARPTPEETEAACEWVRSLAGIAPVVVVYGNHDVPHSLAPLPMLEAAHRIIVADRPATYLVAGVAVACLPWPRKAHLLAQLGRAASSEETGALAQNALRNILRGLGNEMDAFAESEPRVLLAHAMVSGSKTSTGQPLVGMELELSLDDLALARADAVLLGHIHMPQEWTVDETVGPSVVYPGSPRRTAYGEVESKGYVVADWTADGFAGFERIETPCSTMLLISARVDDVECPETGRALRGIVVDRNPEDTELRGAEIRLRYRVAADERELGAREAEAWRLGWLGRGAAAVKVEPEVIAETRARAPEIAAARDLGSKLSALWQAKGVEMDEARAARLIERAHGLEEEVRDAA